MNIWNPEVLQVTADVFSSDRSTAKADIAIGMDQYLTFIADGLFPEQLFCNRLPDQPVFEPL
jgi:hypothetical protein